MPLRAVADHAEFNAYIMELSEWNELKRRSRSLMLRMPCCDTAAIAKTSKLGNFFFAHERRGECATADESPEHLHCKTVIARAAKEAGWSVVTERRGISPDGEHWVADVFCEKEARQLALEVQMSPQPDKETDRRQALYRSSGVRGGWFFGPRGRLGSTAFDSETPVFQLANVAVGQEPSLPAFGVSLHDFVLGLLQGRLRWTARWIDRPHYVEYLYDTCWACHRPVKQIFNIVHGRWLQIGAQQTPESINEGLWHERHYTVASLSNSLQYVLQLVKEDELVAQGLNAVGRRSVINGKSTKYPYSNVCFHCRAPQNNYHVCKAINAALNGFDETRLPSDAQGGFEAPAPDEGAHIGIARISRKFKGSGAWELRSDAAA